MYTNDNEMNNIRRIFIKDVNGSNESNNIVNELTNETSINENENERKIVINELTNGSKQIKKKRRKKRCVLKPRHGG